MLLIVGGVLILPGGFLYNVLLGDGELGSTLKLVILIGLVAIIVGGLLNLIL